jgi:hypothetical protein
LSQALVSPTIGIEWWEQAKRWGYLLFRQLAHLFHHFIMGMELGVYLHRDALSVTAHLMHQQMYFIPASI